MTHRFETLCRKTKFMFSLSWGLTVRFVYIHFNLNQCINYSNIRLIRVSYNLSRWWKYIYYYALICPIVWPRVVKTDNTSSLQFTPLMKINLLICLDMSNCPFIGKRGYIPSLNLIWYNHTALITSRPFTCNKVS